MLKSDEIIKPQSCLNLALPNEMLFVLLARDAAAAETIRFWAGARVAMGLNEPDDVQIKTALETANLMQEQLPVLRAAIGKAIRHTAILPPAEGEEAAP